MRIATNSFSGQFLDQLYLLTARQNRLQLEAATGQRIRTADDDPAAMRRVLDGQTEGATLDQFLKNIGAAGDKATAAYDALRGLKRISDRVTELATLADGTRSPDELKIYGTEVTQLIQQAVQLANSQHNGEYLFGGTRSDQPPFAITLDANGVVTGVVYQGNTDVPGVPIDAATVLNIQTPGANTTGAGARGLVADSRTGADFFGHLIAFQNHLLAGDAASVAAIDRPALAKDEENFLYHIGTNGAIQARLEAAKSVAGRRADAVDGMVSAEADADLAETLVKLNQTQTSYQAALQSGANIMRLSLLDYLR